MARPEPPPRHVIGWDIGGAHVKACLLRDGRVADVAEWACPLWQGLEHLERVLHAAHARWPQVRSAAHAATMTGEMTDLFADREDGVARIAAQLGAGLGAAAGALRFFAGPQQWCSTADLATQWPQVASANWLATATHAAQTLGSGVLVDIGSTTTDLIAFADGRVAGRSRSDADRLACGELAYHGVVRTPLCALGPRIGWRGRDLNVMNELFATSADVYRLTGELDPAHDLHPSADHAPKDATATRRRLARMIGLDARDADDADWLAFAGAWRTRQVALLAGELRRVLEAHGARLGLARGAAGDGLGAVAVSAGCGDFLVADVLAAAGVRWPCRRYADAVAQPLADGAPAALAGWVQVGAPAVAVAALLDAETR